VSMEGKKARPRRKFTAEFKEGAIRLVLREGRSVADVARELDLTESSLHEWVKQSKVDEGI